MRIAPLAFAAALAALALAGCSQSPPMPAPAAQEPEPTLAAATRPSGDGAYGYMESYVMTHPFRRAGETQQFQDAARDDLVAMLEGFEGLHVERHAYNAPDGVNILALRNGTTDPSKWVVLTAHYDVVAARDGWTTIYGAWDNGAGVAALLEMARVTASNSYPFTVAFLFTDQEEQGLIGSSAFLADYADRPDVEIVANVNTDPPGLNWPCGDATGPFPVRIIEAKNGSRPEQGRAGWLDDAIQAGLDAAGVPEEHRDYSAGIPIATANGRGLSGSSDHAAFWEHGIAAAFLGSTPVTNVGPVGVMTYALHTPADTLAQMEARCTGGPGTLAEGFGTIVATMSVMLDAMAATPPPAR